jgi:hypothetical protein
MGRERDLVVGPDRPRQAVLAESSLEDGPRCDCLSGQEPVTGEQKLRVLVGDGERVAVAPVAGLGFPLEVGGSEIVGGFGCGGHNSRVLMRTTATPLQHQSAACQEICGRTGRRPSRHAGIPSGENTQKLSCSPEGVLSPEVAYELCELALNAMRTVARSSTPISQATSSFLLVSREPLVTDPPTHTIARA